MNKNFITFCFFALALTIAGCSDTKTPAKESATAETASTETTATTNTAVAESEKSADNASAGSATAPQVEGTKTITLSNGASVTWIQDNTGNKLNPRSLFSDASDSLYNSLNMPDGIPASG